MAEQITVSAACLDGRVALWERHPDHPDGEVLVTAGNEVASGTGPVVVARTPGVLRALADGRLVLASTANALTTSPLPARCSSAGGPTPPASYAVSDSDKAATELPAESGRRRRKALME